MPEPDCSTVISRIKLIPGLSAESAIDAMGGSESRYEKTLTHMMRQIPSNIRELDGFLYTNGDLSAFAVKAHGIKGALRHVGNIALGNEADFLEKAAKDGSLEYCLELYDAFKKGLLRFYAQLTEAAGPPAGSEASARLEKPDEGNIADFAETLKQAAELADFCDSISAYDVLLPLTRIRFGGNTDSIISRAIAALDQFKPLEALDYITELLNECGTSRL